ncbi:hypothetical protein ABTY20_22960 [Streptomyces sp. NPDC126497]|uniref:hypothetical protein n=1 Tax=Streptomyces sp. NPDC126497 TaxID=3155313 RepID=UPI003327F303
MPVAFRSVGARLKADLSSAGSTQFVTMPAGHAAGDLLLLVLAYDTNTGPTSEPAGWTLLSKASAGRMSSSSLYARVQTRMYYRVATGVTAPAAFVFSKAPWPEGSPYVLGFCVAYSGVDPAGPIEKFAATGTAGTASAQAHPQLTTVADGDWLVSLRTGAAAGARSTTIAGGTNTKRVDDTDGFGELFAALYDSDSTLVPGAQAVRTTFATGGDGLCVGGSTMWSLALKPVTPAAIALPPAAAVAATAYDASVVADPGGWDLCGDSGLPRYMFTVDWAGDGPGRLAGSVLNPNPYFHGGLAGWDVSGGTLDVADAGGVRALRVTPSGRNTVISAFQKDPLPSGSMVPGRTYRVYAWLYSPAGWSDLRAVLDWYDASGVQTGTAPSTAIAVPAGTWTLVTSGGVAPAGTASGRIRLRQGGSTLPAVSDVFYAWGAVLVDESTGGVLLYPAPDEDVTGDIVSDVALSYGRDQERQFSPSSVGSASFTLDNTHRRYSPENAGGPLHGDLDPARAMSAAVTFNGRAYSLFTGRADDFEVHVDFGDRTAGFTFLDGLGGLAGVKLSTAVYSSRHTGDLVHTVLDLAGWSGGRDIDPGASVVRHWWLEGTDALSALHDLVKSEGPPAVAYVAPDGTFVFRDRHHRMLRQASLTSRATFTAGALGDCAADGPADGYSFTKPFTYSHGWRDIVNRVEFDVEEREPASALEVVWSDESTYSLAPGQSVDLVVNASEPFVGAVLPVLGTDVAYFSSGGGVPSLQLNRRSGASATLTVRAVGGPVEVSYLQLRARPLAVRRTVKVALSDPGSVGRHGERTYPDSAPWASPADAEAIANMVLLHYARRRPTVQLRVTSSDPAHFVQVVQRTVSDRIRIVNAEMGLDADFFVERVAHTIQRFNAAGRPPVHSVVLGCERDLLVPENVFTFDQRGAGFDQGVFDLTVADAADEVFVFDDPVQGQFDVGKLGT